ncbi:Hypothetical protein SCF082_LOCUS26669 [Durusdinium trenchii]
MIQKVKAPKLEVKEELKVKPEIKVKEELEEKVLLRPSSTARPVATPQVSFDQPLRALLDKCPQPPQSSRPDVPGLPQDFVWDRDPLVRALQQLYSRASGADVEKHLHLSPWSADQEAIKNLARSSREFVPALEELRRKAVDRAVLLAAERRKKVKEQDADQGHSEGESSGLDFSISDHNGEDQTVATKPALLLPAGWRTESHRRRGRERRVYTDPFGRTYWTLADARKVIDAERTRQNMANLLKNKAKTNSDGTTNLLTSGDKVMDHDSKRQKLT